MENLPRTIDLVSHEDKKGARAKGHTSDETCAKHTRAEVVAIDQTLLPTRLSMLHMHTLNEVCDAIARLAVRGAPALGVAAACALALWAINESADKDTDGFLRSLGEQAVKIGSVRPTAVNLAWGAKRALESARQEADKLAERSRAHATGDAGTAAGSTDADSSCQDGMAALKQTIFACAKDMIREDEAANRAIGANGAALLKPGSNVLTICNAGSLATAYYGTALGVIYSAYEQGRVNHVYSLETRPVMQGARLTMWELMRAGIPCTLISDGMTATVMSQGRVDAVLVGADRIAKNGDTANKIGTLQVAILASYYNIPFYVCAPTSTIDAGIENGNGIAIEERDRTELAGIATPDGAWVQTSPDAADIYNPAFDVTPSELITKYITEQGCIMLQ
jgi:methylthioribose-1-phosphate isomerase